MRLQIDITIMPDYQNPAEYGNLRLSETHELNGQNFMEIASVLGKFHDLMLELKAAKNETVS